MCWVMPPASPLTTLVERMASSSEVLPWSTWPITVTTGARGASVAGSSAAVEHAFLDVGFGDALDAVAQFLGDELGGVGVDHVVDRRHLALLHQNLDDVDRALGHPVGKFLDGDRFRDRHFTNQLFFRLVALFRGAALHAAAERGFRALAHFVRAHGGDQRQPAARPLGRGLGGAGRTLRRRGRAHGAAGTAPEFRGFVFFRFDHGPCAGTGGRFALAEALLGDLVGLFLGDFVVLAALVFLALARLGGLALGLFDGVALLRGSSPLLRRSCVPRPRAGGHRRARGRGGCALHRSGCAAPRRTAWARRRPERVWPQALQRASPSWQPALPVPRAWRPVRAQEPRPRACRRRQRCGAS